MQNLPAPKPLDLETSDKEGAWLIFEKSFRLYLTATGADTKSEAVKRAGLLHLVDEDGRKISDTFRIIEEGENQTSLNQLLQMFREKFIENRHTSFERHIFGQMKQDREEFDKFLIRMRDQANRCSYGDRIHEDICDHIVDGIDCPETKKKLLPDPELNYERAVRICKTQENIMK
ncbi:hypothetical protein SNE40_018162 [Patella caerulea]|uniref:Uncharacterized protein n=1 Tax=Patella caerulea TaxID=87958 RepID=A0AAN8JC11_PATCE